MDFESLKTSSSGFDKLTKALEENLNPEDSKKYLMEFQKKMHRSIFQKNRRRRSPNPSEWPMYGVRIFNRAGAKNRKPRRG